MHKHSSDYEHEVHREDVLRDGLMQAARYFKREGKLDHVPTCVRHARLCMKRRRFFTGRAAQLAAKEAS
jgi:hypothetical protein